MKQTLMWSRETHLDADARSASLAREFVERELLDHDLTDLVDDIRLVVSELATNALRHARTRFRVALHGDADSVMLTVEDGSPDSPVPIDADGLDINGRGLQIVEMVSNAWGVTPSEGGAKAVWASFGS